MHPLTPAERIRRWSAYLWVWRVHRWLALGLGLVLVLLSLTGSILVMHEQVEQWLAPERHVVIVPDDPIRTPLVPVLRALQAEAPAGFRLLRLEPGHDGASDKIIFVGPDRATRWSAYLNPYTGAVLWRGFDDSLFTSWLLQIHMHLSAGRWGYVVTGLAGLALTLLSLTGIWITRDRLGALLRHPLRFRFGSRVAAADLHKWLGVASLYFTFVLGVTGTWFAILIVPRQFSREPTRSLAPAFDLAHLAPIEPMLAVARAQFPDAELLRVAFPADETGRLQVRVLHRRAPVWAKFSHADFDPSTGTLRKVAFARDASTAEKWRSILAPLHFGFHGSPLVQALYVIGGLSPAALAVTGFLIWSLRRRGRYVQRSLRPFSESTATAFHPD